MKSLNIIITRSLEPEIIRKIAGVSSQIRLHDISSLIEAERHGDYSMQEKLDSILAEAEVLYGFAVPANIIARAPNLRWIQTMTAGVEKLLTDDIVKSKIIVTNAGGIHGVQISELVFTMILMLAKHSIQSIRSQQQKQWKKFTPSQLNSKTLGILGLGHIGKEVARLAKAFNMRVLAIRETRQTKAARNVDAMIPSNQLHKLLADSDYIVIALPLTPKTAGLISAAELRAMKPSSYLINIARGAIIDEKALIKALEEGWIAGAGLDTFETEPLPAQSRLWELPNVIITPHIAGTREDYNMLATDLFCENLKRYLNGKRLLKIVNKKNRY